MIFFENSRIKMLVLTVLVLGVFALIVDQWIKYQPLNQIDTKEDTLFSTIELSTSDTVDKIRINLDVGALKVQDLRDELERQVKQDILLEQMRERIANYDTSTSTSAI